ncbi:MAG: lysylphosphatidylglycerol synthase transmembrane domain-containing protein [Bacteroidota bacterium]
MKSTIRNIIFIIVSFTIGGVILYYLYTNYNEAYLEQLRLEGVPLQGNTLMKKLKNDFLSASPFWIFVALLCFTLSNVSRAMRWNLLLKPLGYRPRFINTLLSVLVTYFVNLFIPRMGEVMRAAALNRSEKVPVEKSMGTIVVGRIMDVVMLLLFIGAAFLLEYDTLWSWLSDEAGNEGDGLFSNPIILVLLGLGLVGLVVFLVFRKKIVQTALYKKVIAIVLGFWEGLMSVKKLESPGVFIFHTVFIWAMYFLMNYIFFFAFAPTSELAPKVALMVFVFGAFGIVIPSPGGMGTYHWLVVAALGIYGINQLDAFSFANIAFFSINIFCNIFLGIVSVILLFLINKNYTPSHVQVETTVEK